MTGRMTLYFDGGARPNPGRMEIAVVTGGRSHIRSEERRVGKECRL